MRLPHPRRARPRLVLLAAVGLGLAAPATAPAAATLSSASVPDGEAVVDRQVDVAVAGSSAGTATVRLEVNAPGIACAATSSANTGVKNATRTVGRTSFPAGIRVPFTFGTPGSYTACVYATDAADRRAAPAVAAVPLVVRQPRTTLTVGVPRRITPGTLFPLSVTAFSEVRRKVSVYRNAAATPCGPNSGANQGKGLFSTTVVGGPTTTTRNVRAPAERGLYRFCAYLARSSSDAAPLQIADTGPILVASPPARRCSIPRSEIGRRSRLRVTCTSAITGRIRIKATSPGRSKSVLRTLVGKTASVAVADLRMPAGPSRITVTKNGTVLATKIVRRRR